MPSFLNVWEQVWPTDMNIYLFKGYLPAKYETSAAKRSVIIHCTKYGRPIYRPTNWHGYNVQVIFHPFFQGGRINNKLKF